MVDILIENIGRVKKANIKLENITIVAGVNNTGKSTISKILYSALKPSSEIGRERVCTIIYDKVIDCLEGLSQELKEEKSELIDSTYQVLKDKNYSLLERRLKELEEKAVEKNNEEDEISILSLRADLLLKDTEVLAEYLETEVQDLLKDRPGQKIRIKNDYNRFMEYNPVVLEDGKKNIMNMDIIRKNDLYNIIYIATPYILDKIKFPNNYLTMIEEDFMNDFQRNYFSRNVINLSKMKSTQKDLEIMIEKIIGGKLFLKKPQEIVYQLNNVLNDEYNEFNLNNTATGIITFGILLQFLSNGSIKEGSILIFDEPEVHLHPAWQVKLAEILVKLVKYLKIKLFINSHSSDFIEALQIYSIDENIDGMNAYLAQEEDGKTFFKDVTKKIGVVYRELSKGYDILDQVKVREYDIF